MTNQITVFDVAAYILKKKGRVSALKLQKLVYYCQAWSLAWDDKPLFRARIEAWSSGPVCPQLYKQHRGKFNLTVRDFSALASVELSAEQKETVDVVLETYGDKDAEWLVEQTHLEQPWRAARKGVPDMRPCKAAITLESMAEYYCSLHSSEQG